MRVFHFGRVTIEEAKSRSYGEFALHIQCPWRIEGPDGIVTGRDDLWEPAEPNDDIDWDSWDFEKNDNLQDRRIRSLLGGHDTLTRSAVNATSLLVVEHISTDAVGGATLSLSGGYRLVIFPSGSADGEDWRLLEPPSERPHFVVGGGRIIEPEDHP